jgi:predicted aldo/keto reductase-like oxidoreductase
MGKALRDGYRDKIFLMTKIDGRSRESAAPQIDESLQRLQPNHIDLMQFHEIIRMEEPDRIFAEGGAMEAIQAAKQAGKIRYIGFTGHKDPLVHLPMLEIAANHKFRFDAVQMPLNVMDAHFRSFERQVLPLLLKDEIGVLGMKALGDPFILRSNTVTPIECLHYAMNLPTSTVIKGSTRWRFSSKLWRQHAHSSVEQGNGRGLLARRADAPGTGKYELFKTSNRYDGTAHNPQWPG